MEQKLPFLSTAVMTSCNGLTLVEGEIVGDPLEKAALQAVQWMMIGPDLVTSKPSRGGDRLHILRRVLLCSIYFFSVEPNVQYSQSTFKP